MQAPEVLGGRYELRGVLGRGGMAEVRDGWDIRLDRPVAVKLLHPMFTTQPDNRMRFDVEARAAAALNHPHIVSVHDSGEHNGTPYIVMERLSGQTLADVIARGPLPQPRVRSILDDVLSALATAHAAGVLHRDIKPANILFSPSGHAKVADFGIAKSAGSVHTVTGEIVGTMAYLSADRIAGRPATVGDDLYAVGVVG
jgi:serine/threonine-protein kinase